MVGDFAFLLQLAITLHQESHVPEERVLAHAIDVLEGGPAPVHIVPVVADGLVVEVFLRGGEQIVHVFITALTDSAS